MSSSLLASSASAPLLPFKSKARNELRELCDALLVKLVVAFEDAQGDALSVVVRITKDTNESKDFVGHGKSLKLAEENAALSALVSDFLKLEVGGRGGNLATLCAKLGYTRKHHTTYSSSSTTMSNTKSKKILNDEYSATVSVVPKSPDSALTKPVNFAAQGKSRAKAVSDALARAYAFVRPLYESSFAGREDEEAEDEPEPMEDRLDRACAALGLEVLTKSAAKPVAEAQRCWTKLRLTHDEHPALEFAGEGSSEAEALAAAAELASVRLSLMARDEEHRDRNARMELRELCQRRRGYNYERLGSSLESSGDLAVSASPEAHLCILKLTIPSNDKGWRPGPLEFRGAAESKADAEEAASSKALAALKEMLSSTREKELVRLSQESSGTRSTKNARMAVRELCTSHGWTYLVRVEEIPSTRTFTAMVCMSTGAQEKHPIFYQGEGPSKREAEEAAARKAWEAYTASSAATAAVSRGFKVKALREMARQHDVAMKVATITVSKVAISLHRGASDHHPENFVGRDKSPNAAEKSAILQLLTQLQRDYPNLLKVFECPSPGCLHALGDLSKLQLKHLQSILEHVSRKVGVRVTTDRAAGTTLQTEIVLSKSTKGTLNYFGEAESADEAAELAATHALRGFNHFT